MGGQNLLNQTAMERHKGIMIDSGTSSLIIPEAEHALIVEILNAKCR